MVEYSKVSIKLSDTQLKKLKTVRIGLYYYTSYYTSLYLMINERIGHFEEKNQNKYVVLDDVDENKEVS